jgi:hypothetical protein
MGIVRHAEAGYDEALDFGARANVALYPSQGRG